MRDPKSSDMQPGNLSGGISSSGGPTFKDGNPAPDKFAESVHDGSDAALSSSSPYDCCPFGRDYEPLPTFVAPSPKWPKEESADSYLDTFRSFGRGAQMPDTDSETHK